MTVDAGETMLLVDYDRNDADIKLAVLASPSTADKGYDLTIRGQNVNKMSEVGVGRGGGALDQAPSDFSPMPPQPSSPGLLTRPRFQSTSHLSRFLFR